jgi:hypothetical protein
MKTLKELKEHIVKTKSGYKLVSKSTGKNLGTASSLAGIKKREAQVQYFKHQKEDIQLDEMGAGAVGAAGPTNVVSSGAIAGSGGKGGEPGVDMRKRRKHNPIMQSMNTRKAPK